MGQLRVVYYARGEYIALTVRRGLGARGIPSVQLLNEIPMHTGFTFEARPWAEIMVSEEDFARARAVITDLELMLTAGDGHVPDWPSMIKVNTTRWLGIVWFAFIIARLMLGVYCLEWGFELPLFSSPAAFFVWLGMDLVLATWLAALNRRMLARQVSRAVGGLLALPCVMAWLVFEALLWLARQIIWLAQEIAWLIRYGPRT